MVKEEIDEQVLEERKKAQIEFRNKRKNTRIFLIVGTLVQTIETFICVMVLFVGLMAILSRVCPNPTPSQEKFFSILTIASLIGGIVIGFKIYLSLVRWFIKKKNLEDKIEEKVLARYAKIETK